MTPFKVWHGKPYPLGATWKGNGVNFALYSENATGVDLASSMTRTRRRKTCASA